MIILSFVSTFFFFLTIYCSCGWKVCRPLIEGKKMANIPSTTFDDSEENLLFSLETYASLSRLLDNDDNVLLTQLKDIPDLVPIADSVPFIQSSSSCLPATTPWPGNCGFQVKFIQEKSPKHVNWTYSTTQNKLYIKKDVSCPFSFFTNSMMPKNVFIRAMAVYTSPEHASEVVTRCITHCSLEVPYRVDTEHLVRCESNQAMYQVDPETKRQCVIVPFENPPVGQNFSTYLYKFPCFSSCCGGPNRRPLTLVITLEQENNLLGRLAINLKICASPGRDRASDEQISLPERAIVVPTPSRKKTKRRRRRKPEFVIKTDNRKCYEFLKRMRRFHRFAQQWVF
ncbi:tumor protein 63 [Caerostris extrusa]|uniref:Tumor protein 63 n=1 Tax=Caerostris extrusa TaxID=172846 RepID=A0AAV4VGT4_CAEEX|nr:tumor protein 63 [Caerostris extrusa]